MSFELLKKQIEEDNTGNLYLFYGPEKYLMNMYLNAIEKKIIQGGTKIINVSIYESNTEPQAIIDCCETIPVMSDKRLVIVKDYGLFNKTKGNNAVSVFESYVEQIPEHACLIFTEKEVDKRRKIYKQIDKYGLIAAFEYRKPYELVNWIIKELKKYGKIIGKNQASRIVENCEASMADIYTEIEKIAMYLEDKSNVDDEIIDNIMYKSVKSRIFELTDAIAEKNISRAIAVLKDMLILKEPVPLIVFMIARQLRQMIQMRLFTEEGLSVKEAASKIGIHPYIGGKVLKYAQKFNTEYLKKSMEKCLEYDISLKTGKIKQETAVELLIFELC